jgi:hypothetical protein
MELAFQKMIFIMKYCAIEKEFYSYIGIPLWHIMRKKASCRKHDAVYVLCHIHMCICLKSLSYWEWVTLMTSTNRIKVKGDFSLYTFMIFNHFYLPYFIIFLKGNFAY